MKATFPLLVIASLATSACDRDTPELYPPDRDAAFAQPNTSKTTGTKTTPSVPTPLPAADAPAGQPGPPKESGKP